MSTNLRPYGRRHHDRLTLNVCRAGGVRPGGREVQVLSTNLETSSKSRRETSEMSVLLYSPVTPLTYCSEVRQVIHQRAAESSCGMLALDVGRRQPVTCSIYFPRNTDFQVCIDSSVDAIRYSYRTITDVRPSSPRH